MNIKRNPSKTPSPSREVDDSAKERIDLLLQVIQTNVNIEGFSMFQFKYDLCDNKELAEALLKAVEEAPDDELERLGEQVAIDLIQSDVPRNRVSQPVLADYIKRTLATDKKESFFAGLRRILGRLFSRSRSDKEESMFD